MSEPSHHVHPARVIALVGGAIGLYVVAVLASVAPIATDVVWWNIASSATLVGCGTALIAAVVGGSHLVRAARVPARAARVRRTSPARAESLRKDR